MLFRKLILSIGSIGGLVYASSLIAAFPMPGLGSLLDQVGTGLPPTNALVSVHAIWFSIFVPTLVAAVWIWTKLRLPKVWWILSLIAVLVAVLWVGNDLLRFAEVKGSFENAGLRVLYFFLSESDKPVLQLAFGFLMAGLLSLRLNRRADEPIIAQQ